MFRNKIIVFTMLAVAFMITFAYCQERAENRQILTISGTLAKVDFVGSSIVVKAGNEQMALSVPDDVVITKGTEKLGIEDLEESDPVVIQYFSPSPGQYTATTIVDNNAIDE